MPKISSEEAFRSFLHTISPEHSHAGEKYVELRERVERFFEWRECKNVEELTDIVFDRIIRKISQGEIVENAEAYSVAVAKFVLLEYRREAAYRSELDDDLTIAASQVIESNSDDDQKSSRRFECLDRCLEGLSGEDRNLLIGYFDTQEDTMIATRKTLATKAGITLNSLRIRISRLKTKLEKCVKDCCSERIPT